MNKQDLKELKAYLDREDVPDDIKVCHVKAWINFMEYKQGLHEFRVALKEGNNIKTIQCDNMSNVSEKSSIEKIVSLSPCLSVIAVYFSAALTINSVFALWNYA